MNGLTQYVLKIYCYCSEYKDLVISDRLFLSKYVRENHCTKRSSIEGRSVWRKTQPPSPFVGGMNTSNEFLRKLKHKCYPPILHCAHLLLLLSGLSFRLIPYMGINIHRGRDRKILSSIVEVMEVSDSEEDSYLSWESV